jgi:chemotaxis protein histidine kinase CheA/CheY-like chemotaxis protein
MITGEIDSSIKDQSALNAFVERASGRLHAVRNGILIFDQDHTSTGDIDVALRSLQLLCRDASENERDDIVELSGKCESLLTAMLSSEPSPTDVGHVLDLVARIEERLLKIPLDSDDFLNDISGFVERSFSFLTIEDDPELPATNDVAYEIDDETLEIFRSEAGELLSNISASVHVLHSNSDDREALWEVRRNAHTFKGAAGIVGLTAASNLAHRVEDLLDKMVETSAAVDPEIVNLLARASKRLEVFTLGTAFDEEAGPIDELYAEFEEVIATVPARRRVGQPEREPETEKVATPTRSYIDAVKPIATPIVRVSLERLDDLIKLSRTLTINRSELIESFSLLFGDRSEDKASRFLAKIESLFETQHRLTEELQEKLFRIRMVRFGTLETRLSRAVHVTCEEENKRAYLTVENGDIEVDTQVIDALIEPLLHLLKNAVVHGIETEDTRRLIRKPEKGHIRIVVDTDPSGVTLVVSDDGHGISASKLKNKAIQDGLIGQDAADRMSDTDAFELIFNRGLTTAGKLTLNAGRGLGMCIVKESLESCGGSVSVTSEPQVGTTFVLKLPLALKKSVSVARTAHLPPDSIKPASSKPALVLVVDDSASIRRQTSKLIESTGNKVITAINGADAIELLLSNVWRPDLILSDVEMPVMDGWAFLECIKNTDGLEEIPVVMVTSLTSEENVQRAFDMGAIDYKIKPISVADVTKAIDAVL